MKRKRPLLVRRTEFSAANGVDDVVDLHEAADGLGGQGDGRRRHQQRLDDVLVEDVGDHALANVDAGVDLALSVSVAQLGDGGDGVEPGILGQRVGDDLQGFGEGFEAVGVGADNRVGVLHELPGQFSFCKNVK